MFEAEKSKGEPHKCDVPRNHPSSYIVLLYSLHPHKRIKSLISYLSGSFRAAGAHIFAVQQGGCFLCCVPRSLSKAELGMAGSCLLMEDCTSVSIQPNLPEVSA